MSKLVSAIAVVIALGVPCGSHAVQNLRAFEGSARMGRSKMAIHWQGGSGRGGTGVVTLNSTPYKLQCAELRSVDVKGGGKALGFFGRAVDAAGRLLMVRAIDRGLSDQIGFRTTTRIAKKDPGYCGAGDIPMTPIDAGDFMGIDLGVDVPPWTPPVINLPTPTRHSRILTYNTAFLYAAATYPDGLPSPLDCTSSCDPITVPPFPAGCACDPMMTMWPNDYRFGNLSEPARAIKMAQRIVETDQDIVVLNEMFHPAARTAFVTVLAQLGPYKHYISLLRGHAPVEGFTLNELVAMQTGGALGTFLENLPDFFDYEAVPNPSGIMIFSKYPFLPLQGSSIVNDSLCLDPECDYAGMNGNAPLTPQDFAFDVYDDCELEDCWASKGVGLVKIDTPGEASYVAFTHMQADYYDTFKFHPGTRAKQFAAIRNLMTGAIPAAEVSGAAIYLAGDLNVIGAPRGSNESSEAVEWHQVFDPASSSGNVAGGFFACGNGVDAGNFSQPCMFGINGTRQMTDAWGFESSPTDLGISNEDDGYRLDYLVHSVGRRCMQHATIAWDLRADPDGSGGVTWLSDHMPLRGDFGTSADWCSPNDDPEAALPSRNLHDLKFGPTNCATGGFPNPICHQDEIVTAPEAKIGPAGAFQWFRITQPGTYSFDLDPLNLGEHVEFVIYHHTDLSRPIRPFDEKEGEMGIIYSMPEPPYYIRTFAVDAFGEPDRMAQNRPYTLKVHQHLCRTPEDACVLDPGMALASPYEYVWPQTTNPGNELRDLYWRFKTSGVKQGHLTAGTGANILFPRVQMQIEAGTSESYKCMTQVEPVIERYNDPTFPTILEDTIAFTATDVDADGDWEDDGYPDDLHLAPDLPGKVNDEFQQYFLKLTRKADWLDPFNPCNAGMTSWVSHHTDMTYVVPTRLQMWQELDDDLGAEDNLNIQSQFDAILPPLGSVQKALEQPDSGSVKVDLDSYDVLKGYYVGQAWVLLWEIDEGEPIEPWGANDSIPSLSPWLVSIPEKGQPAAFMLYTDDPDPVDADYYYYLWYRTCHIATEPACDNP